MDTTNKPTDSKRIIRINASALKVSSCFRHFYYTVFLGLKAPINYNDVEFGSAVHVFLRTMYETNADIGQGIIAARKYFETTKMLIKPKKKYLDSFHLCKVCITYWEWLQANDTFKVLTMPDGKPAVELTFSNKVYEDDKLIVLLEGTIDKVGKIDNGCYAIGDYKTTSSWDKEEYLDNYRLSPQLMFYHHNIRLFAKDNPDSLLGQIANKPFGQFIDGIFLQGKDKTEFRRSEIFLPKQKDFDEFQKMLDHFVNKVIEYAYDDKSNEVEPEPEGKLNGACTSVYGRCKYFNICGAQDDIVKRHIIKNDFVQQEYLPLKITADKDL